ncbi:hypothetical protein CYLTODRAFT_326086, partial [Cylindrobasidium torrendii FP15055 ss-10]
PFGGINMIFLGDFAQLPPVVGSSLFNRNVGSYGKTENEQSASLGKAIWHQVNRVVILRENVRLRGTTTSDIKMREMLSNLRYKSCTPSDIAFLRTLLHSSPNTGRTIADNDMRNVSIITPFHVHREEMNRLGSVRFAKETGQELFHFFSEDTPSEKASERNERRKRGVARVDRLFTDKVQDLLWSLPSHCSDSLIPGKISLCVGMPVMIRYNLATELNITKGQQGTVHSWSSGIGSRGQRVLETVFVHILNPSCNVNIPGLPTNVVPVPTPSAGTSISVNLPDGSVVNVNRKECYICPNFAMTAHCSQGMSREINPVYVDQSPTHNGIYTALSRSTSATGTLILKDFNMEDKLTGGVSGDLRQ